MAKNIVKITIPDGLNAKEVARIITNRLHEVYGDQYANISYFMEEECRSIFHLVEQ